MEKILYSVIKTAQQYNKYCVKPEELVESNKATRRVQDEIELLTLLIEKYDQEHNTFKDADPIELLKYMMQEHQIQAVEFANILDVSAGLVSDMLHYKKGMSKSTIRILSVKFRLNQEAFNRPYKLLPTRPAISANIKKAKRSRTKKRLALSEI